MSNLVMWNLIVGFLVPNLIAIVQQPKWSQRARAWFTAVACIFFGAGTAYFTGQFNLGDIVGSILTMGVAAITFYKGLWKPSGIAPAIENATTTNKNERGHGASMIIIQIAAVLVILAALVYLFNHLPAR